MFHTSSRAFTLIETLVLIGIIAVLIAIVITALFTMRRESQLLKNQNQVRGLHQSFVTWSHASQRGALLPSYPGREWGDERPITPDGPKTEFSGPGDEPAARFAMLMAGNYFTPDYIINPADPAKRPIIFDQTPSSSVAYATLTSENYSYAMLALPGSENEAAEWEETLNADAVVLSDRARGAGPGNISSVWTRQNAGRWEGHVARNDGSAAFETSHEIKDTRYGQGEVNTTDDLFADAPDADDAYLVHADATTAYSEE